MANDRRSVLLRLRFDSVEQLKAHLHLSDSRAVILFRDPGLELDPGATILVELSVAPTEQTRVCRASMLARSDGHGSWLDVLDLRAVREMQERGLIVRKARRLGADLPLRVRRTGGTEHLVTLVDVSAGGARIRGGLPKSLLPRHHLELTLAAAGPGQPAALGTAEVAWLDAGEAGVVFDRTHAPSRIAVNRLIQSLQQEWEKARTSHHPPGCCAGGILLEPPVPRLRVDGRNEVQRADGE